MADAITEFYIVTAHFDYDGDWIELITVDRGKAIEAARQVSCDEVEVDLYKVINGEIAFQERVESYRKQK